MNEAPRTILGIDPGTASTGYGVLAQRGNRLELVEFGVVSTSRELELHQRLGLIFDGIAAVLARHRPAEVAVESLFFNVNARTAFAVGQARGVAMLACSRAGCGVFEYTPQEVKLAVVGYGKAEKGQVQEMVRVLLRLSEPPRPDHAADALGIAICHAHGRGVRLGAQRSLARSRAARAGS